MKKILSILLVVVMLCAMLPQTMLFASAEAYSGTCGKNLTWSYNESTKTLTISGSGEMEDFEWNGRPWESFVESIKTINLPDSLTSIGAEAFCSCISLPSVTIPDSVTSIGAWAFNSCFSLPSVTIPDSVKNIGDYAFSNCTDLTNITIPAGVTSIGLDAFGWCDSMTSITVDKNNPSYSSDTSGVLFNKDKTKLICCPSGYSGAYTIPSSVTSIDDDAFSYCYNLTSVTIPVSVTSIGGWAFNSCISLPSVTIPDSVKNIGDYAFSNCTDLTNITIPAGVTTIGLGAFDFCVNMTNITVDKNNPFYSSDASGVLFNKDKTELVCCPAGYSGAYEIPAGVAIIGENAFYGRYGLTDVIIGESVIRISDWAFGGCDNLTSAYFRGKAPSIRENVFKTFDESSDEPINIPGLTLYYIEGKAGWTSPTWYGYPTAKWVPYNEDDPTTNFTDVKITDWYYSAVSFAVSNGLFNGMTATTFEPNTAMNRAMLVTVLWRYAGSPKEGTNTFADVKAGQWYTDAVAWASSNGIVGGVGSGKFDPNGNVTREQLAAILFRYCEYKGISTNGRGNLSSFPDKAKVSSWATNAYSWAVGEGLIGGNKINGQTLLDPQGNATRAQVATILMRFIEGVASK